MTQSKWTKLYDAIQFIYFCATVNVLFLVGVAVGGVFLGIGPSLLAAHQLVKDYYQKESNRTIQSFIQSYRTNFKVGNQLFFSWLMVMTVLLIDSQLLRQLNIENPLILFLGSAIQLMVICWGMTLAPMFVFYQLRVKNYLSLAFSFNLYHLVDSLLALLWLGICFYGSYLLPGIIPIFSFGIWIVGNMGFYLKFFEENEKRVKA